jgi:hypothetical protein
MSQKSAIVKRALASLAVGLLLAGGISEGAFRILQDKNDRAPQRVELVIPRGTAERVAAGQAVPSLPADMVFVVGDTLVVKNEDVTGHQLGPLWVPPGSSASLALDQPNSYSYACTFQPSRYLGLDVRSRLTLGTRLVAILTAGLPMGALIAIYSVVVFPLRPSPNENRP